jgi:hypothetical protein
VPARVADRRRDAASRPAPRGGPARGVRAESRVRSAAGSRRKTRPVPRAASRVPPRRVAACEPRAANESSDEKEDERRRDSKGRGGFGRPRKVRPITPEPRNPGILGRPRPDRRQSRSSHDERLPRSLRQRPPHAAAAVLVVWASGRIGSLPVSTPTSPIRSLATCRRARRARTAATFCGALRTGTRTCERPLAVRPSPSVGDCGKPQRLTNVAPQSISVIVL